MEKPPILSREQHANLLADLKAAEAEAAAGRSVNYDSEAFRQRLLNIYRNKQP